MNYFNIFSNKKKFVFFKDDKDELTKEAAAIVKERSKLAQPLCRKQLAFSGASAIDENQCEIEDDSTEKESGTNKRSLSSIEEVYKAFFLLLFYSNYALLFNCFYVLGKQPAACQNPQARRGRGKLRQGNHQSQS